MQVEFHSSTECANNEFNGTITMAVDGRLAIVKVHAENESEELKKTWVTVPAEYDFTVHHKIVWRDGLAAAAIIIMVYGVGGDVTSVTAVHNY